MTTAAGEPTPLVKKFTQYSTTVATMPEAWQFVMSRIDGMGSDPTVHIEPEYECYLDENDDHQDLRTFLVVVSGNDEETPAQSAAHAL